MRGTRLRRRVKDMGTETCFNKPANQEHILYEVKESEEDLRSDC